jgi:thiol-disulfide isomerase/thioredoxin
MLIKNIFSYDEFENYLNSYKNIIVNISAGWCKPCMTIKPMMEKYINVINENNFIYLKIDNSIYEQDDRFEFFFRMKKIPFFIFIKDKKYVESFVSGDFSVASKKIFDYIKKISGNVIIEDENIIFEKDNDF